MPRGSALWFCGPFAPCCVLRLSQRHADAAGITSTKQVPHAKSGNLSPKCTLSQFAWHVLPRNARFSLRVSRTTASSACNIKHFPRSEIGHCAGTRSRSQIIVHFSVFLPSNISQGAFLDFLATTLPHKTKPASRTPVEHPAKTPSHIIFPQARPDWTLPTRAP